MLTLLVVHGITLRHGWCLAFIATGALGFIWILCWLTFYYRPADDAKLCAVELRHIQSDPPDPDATPTAAVPWRTMLRLRQAWAIALGKLFTDPIWWIYLFWMPDFLSRNLGLNLSGMRLPLFVIYSGACVGSIGGGWLSSSLIKKGWSVNSSRKTALLACALAVTPIMIAARTTNAWLAVFLIAIAAGAHQGWSANIYTLASDMFPRSAVACVVGFATMAGAFSGMFAPQAVGYILQRTGSYIPIFVMAGLAYLVAFGFVQVLAPRLKPAQL